MTNKIYSFSGLLASILFYSAFLFLVLNFSEETKELIIDSAFSITSLKISEKLSTNNAKSVGIIKLLNLNILLVLRGDPSFEDTAVHSKSNRQCF